MIERRRVEVSNVDFYLSKENNVVPIGKVSGEYYLLNEKPVNGKYKVTRKPNLFLFLDESRGYIKASDIEGLSIDRFIL